MAEVPGDAFSSPLSRLAMGLAVQRVRKQVEEAAADVIGLLSFERDLMVQRSEYVSEVQRILDELKLTVGLLEEIDGQKALPHRTHEPEELLNYYSGVFFDLVHQLKDKLFILVELLLRKPPTEQPCGHPATVTVAKFLESEAETLNKIGITDPLKAWDERETGAIAVVLKRRTAHHHFASPLQVKKGFLDVRMSRLLQAAQFSVLLSEEGKQQVKTLGDEAFDALKKETAEKQRATIAVIEGNVDEVSSKLAVHFQIPTDIKDFVQTVVSYSESLAAQQIKNETSEAKMQVKADQLREMLVACAKNGKVEDRIVSVYLVGSAARGEMVPGRSDLNLYVITRNVSMVCDNGLGFVVTCLSEADFANENRKKDRFLCWSDGLLLMGKPYEFHPDEFPKPGVLLALLLNEHAKEDMEKLKSDVAVTKEDDFPELRRISLKIAKLGLDYGFGLAMGMKPFYSSSRVRRIEHLEKVFPTVPKIGILKQIYLGTDAFKKADLPAVIDSVLSEIEKNQPVLDAARARVDELKRRR